MKPKICKCNTCKMYDDNFVTIASLVGIKLYRKETFNEFLVRELKNYKILIIIVIFMIPILNIAIFLNCLSLYFSKRIDVRILGCLKK